MTTPDGGHPPHPGPTAPDGPAVPPDRPAPATTEPVVPDTPQTTPEPGDGHTEARSPFGLDRGRLADEAAAYRPNRAARRRFEQEQRRLARRR